MKDAAYYYDLKNDIKAKFIESGCAEIKDIESFDHQIENLIIAVEDSLREDHD